MLFDVVAWLRLARSFWLYAGAPRIARGRAIRRNGRCRFLDIDVPILSDLLVRAEADLAWTLARHAARLAGIGVDRIVRVEHPAPTSRLALWVREGTYFKGLLMFEARAERMAAHIRALHDPFRPAAMHLSDEGVCLRPDNARLAPAAADAAGFGASAIVGARRQRGPPLSPILPIAA
jgi:hypothetical protein